MSILNKLFSTKEREKVITYLLNNPSKPHRVRDVAKRLSISLGSISVFFAILKKNKILRRSGNEFRVDATSPLAKATKLMINIIGLDIGPLKKIPGLEGVGVYGSCANGTNREGSDMDLWAKVNKSVDFDVVAAASRQLKEKMKRDVQLLILDPGKLAQLKEEDPIFFYSLIYGSVVLYGKSLQD
jgi:predicted nucleotidyltransferase